MSWLCRIGLHWYSKTVWSHANAPSVVRQCAHCRHEAEMFD